VATTWEALYRSPAQGLWALLVLPVLFLAWLAVRGAKGAGVEPRAETFVRRWAAVFALVAIVDLVATGPLELPLVPFVLLGDFRVFALILVVMHPARPRLVTLVQAALWTLVVPVVAYGTIQLVETIAIKQPDTLLWCLYEIFFVLLAEAFVIWLLPRVAADREPVRRYLRAVLAFVVLYYALWALSDVVTLSGYDWGWGLRMLPNQLYYGLFVPFAYLRFFRTPASSASTQAAT
jgi:hypothetical protein